MDHLTGMTTARQKPKHKLAHQIREHLLALMEGGSLGPGDPLPSERELMRAFDVGRPVVREAMQSLQGLGLVEIRHGERAKVAEPSLGRMVEQFGETMRHLLANSPASLEHLKEARLAYEKSLAEQAARKRTDADIERMQRILEAQAEARTSMTQFLHHDAEFHRAIASVSGNPIFTALTEAIFSWLADFHIDLVLLPGREQLTLDEHQEILDAIEARDAGRAAKAMQDHLTRANVLYHRTHLSPKR